MPALDTEVLFALSPNDRKHHQAIHLLGSRRDLVATDVCLLEFMAVLRARGRSSAETSEAMLDVGAVLREHGVEEVGTVTSSLVALQCELESKYGLSFYDSFLAASALSLDSAIVSDDTAFDRVPGLSRVPLR
ncbi:MAG: type II toxin-antitoxin system VapC family toxin [Nitrososphaerales archaeon]|nr:type II toxin-antitoxin system VapC family toxin [Nitrososphaerales archaeon]